MSQSPLRLGIIGCGAVVEWFHLPAISRCEDLKVTAVVDANEARAREFAGRLGGAASGADYRAFLHCIDAALVAVPNVLHAAMGCDLMRAGVHVLLEKPMAVTAAECDQLIQAAAESRTVLAVGLVRRFSNATRLIGELLASGAIGRVESCTIADGGVFGWPMASDALLRRDISGGGVLIDAGVHVVDLLLHWLGPVSDIRYFDDNGGGTESDCRAELVMASGVQCSIEFSRIRRMPGRWVFRGSEGVLEIGPGFNPEIRLHRGAGSCALVGHAAAITGSDAAELDQAFEAQLADFVDAIRKRRSPLVGGSQGRHSVEVIEKCYAVREPLALPWTGAITEAAADVPRDAFQALRGKQALVIGGTGFIGSRLVESLVLDCGARVRVLVRNYARAARIARLPIEMVRGDMTDAGVLRSSAAGCDVIFHAAYGNSGDEKDQRRATVDGTRFTMEAALAAGRPRVVYLSTLDVYGLPRDGVLTEAADRAYSNRPYGDSKLDAEKLALEYARGGLPLTILQPTVVYGPFGPFWTVAPLVAIRAAEFAVIDGGGGFCNAVFVDDLVRAMILAAVNPQAVGETFLISGEKPVTWREFYGAYADMAGIELLSISSAESVRRYRAAQRSRHLLPRLTTIFRENTQVRDRILSSPEVHGLIAAVKPLIPGKGWEAAKAAAYGKPAPPDPLARVSGLPPDQVRYYQAKMAVSTEKAQRVLGFRPSYPFERAMQATEAWARWANLID